MWNEPYSKQGPSRSLILRLAEVLDADRKELLHLAGKGNEEMDELRTRIRELEAQLARKSKATELDRVAPTFSTILCI